MTDEKCRSCYGVNSTTDNPFIESPCKCLGAIKLIHAECLKAWLNRKVTIKQNKSATTYSWKKFACDICKQEYPEKLLYPNGEELKIVEIKKPESNYMVIKSIFSEDASYNCKFQ